MLPGRACNPRQAFSFMRALPTRVQYDIYKYNTRHKSNVWPLVTQATQNYVCSAGVSVQSWLCQCGQPSLSAALNRQWQQRRYKQQSPPNLDATDTHVQHWKPQQTQMPQWRYQMTQWRYQNLSLPQQNLQWIAGACSYMVHLSWKIFSWYHQRWMQTLVCAAVIQNQHSNWAVSWVATDAKHHRVQLQSRPETGNVLSWTCANIFFAIIVGQTRVMLNPANKSGPMGELPGVNAPFPWGTMSCIWEWVQGCLLSVVLTADKHCQADEYGTGCSSASRSNSLRQRFSINRIGNWFQKIMRKCIDDTSS